MKLRNTMVLIAGAGVVAIAGIGVSSNMAHHCGNVNNDTKTLRTALHTCGAGAHHGEACSPASAHKKGDHPPQEAEHKSLYEEIMAGALHSIKAARSALEEENAEEALKMLDSGIQTMTALSLGKPLNTVCPVMESAMDPAAPPEALHRTVDGVTIGLCCDPCGGRWDGMSDGDRKEAAKTSVGAAADAHHDHHHHHHHQGHHDDEKNDLRQHHHHGHDGGSHEQCHH